MKLKCNKCGKKVSTEVPLNTIVRAYIECPECVEEDEKNESEIIDKIEENIKILLSAILAEKISEEGVINLISRSLSKVDYLNLKVFNATLNTYLTDLNWKK